MVHSLWIFWFGVPPLQPSWRKPYAIGNIRQSPHENKSYLLSYYTSEVDNTYYTSQVDNTYYTSQVANIYYTN